MVIKNFKNFNKKMVDQLKIISQLIGFIKFLIFEGLIKDEILENFQKITPLNGH